MLAQTAAWVHSGQLSRVSSRSSLNNGSSECLRLRLPRDGSGTFACSSQSTHPLTPARHRLVHGLEAPRAWQSSDPLRIQSLGADVWLRRQWMRTSSPVVLPAASPVPSSCGLTSFESLSQGMWGGSRRTLVTATSAQPPSATSEAVKIKILLSNQVAFGERHAIYGSHGSMGQWQSEIAMEWSDVGWNAELTSLPPGDEVEYKFVIVRRDGSLTWETGPNRKLQVPQGQGGLYEMTAGWNNTTEVVELASKGSNGIRVRAEQGVGGGEVDGASTTKEKAGDSAPQSQFVSEWQGKDVQFMSSNSHSRDRQGKWDLTGLDGAARMLVEADRGAGNWWRKLEVVRDLLVPSEGLAQRATLDALVNVAIYLRWINTGAIPCVEDGGHHRPNRHADISRRIFRQLEWEMGSKDTTPNELVVLRNIHLGLPAFSAEFTQSTPLTRIRDIAHRNDIPHNLKQEIKHTIQNKLHRNAGPEDLVATEGMLMRITKTPGEYSSEFVEEFKVFYKELKDFFNAGSVVDHLEVVREALDAPASAILATFLDRKKRLDSLPSTASPATVMECIVGCLHALTGLRAVLLKGLESGLRNDAPDTAIATRQKWRLSEIGLEEYSFVLLSRFINALEASGGAAAVAADARASNTARVNHPLGAIVLGMRQLGLSGFQQAECFAIENELSAWQSAGIVDKEGPELDVRTWALRLKATLDRVRRLASVYSEALLQIYPTPAAKLGHAFGIAPHMVRVFAEGEIRASVVFQMSKLCSLLLKALRLVSGDQGWDVLVPGTRVGKLVEVKSIDPELLSRDSDGPVVLLVKEASGDEEVFGIGAEIVGVVLLQELPHLSHLGVRARQAGVPFVTCEDEERVAELRALLGHQVRVSATADGVWVSAFDGSQNGTATSAGPPQRRVQGRETRSGPRLGARATEEARMGHVLPLESVDAAVGGSKAAACGKLALLAVRSVKVKSENGEPCTFEAPQGVCIPFGAMEAALAASGGMVRFQELREAVGKAAIEGGQLDGLCNELQRLVAGLRPPPEVLYQVGQAFRPGARLIVRSSANVEDLEGMSGAGLYESVPNVSLADPDAFAAAVAAVWASLYTRRAVLSRRAADVEEKAAAMAVLVQELLEPSLSFVLHTVDPRSGDASAVTAEIALGLGETLASGTRGTPWRLAASKKGKEVKTLAFANFSESLRASGGADGKVTRQVADYSRMPLSVDHDVRIGLGQRLAAIGSFLEKELGGPQDVEGAVVGHNIYVVQSRPQPL